MNETIKNMVIEQFGDKEYFNECAADILNHGASGGFNGFIYYNDTIPFGEKLREHIKPVLREMADDLGFDGVFSLMNTFRCCDELTQDQIADGWYNAESSDHTQVMNCLAWFALEEVAQQVIDEQEEVQHV